jgi:hypothetical protein
MPFCFFTYFGKKTKKKLHLCYCEVTTTKQQGEFPMTILHKTNLISNPKIRINNRGGRLTVDGGMTLITEFLHKLHFDETVNELIHFSNKRKFCQHTTTRSSNGINFKYQ